MEKPCVICEQIIVCHKNATKKTCSKTCSEENKKRVRKAYQSTPAYKETQAIHRKTPVGRAAQKRYKDSTKGKKSKRGQNKRYNEKK